MPIWMTEMTEFPPDGVADCGTRVQGTLQVCQLPFDSDRARTFVTVPMLISVFHICRYQWSERGVCVPHLSRADTNGLGELVSVA